MLERSATLVGMPEKPRTNPLTGTVVMEPPREEAPPETVVVPTAVAPTHPRPQATPFPMARRQPAQEQGGDRDSKLPWRETRDDVKPAAHALSGTMVVEPPAPETVVLPAPVAASAPAPMPAPAPAPIREDLLPPKDPWGTALPAPAPAPAPPPPPEKRANPRTGMMKSFYDGKKG